jgi:AcrR family transcriptional regulator
MPRVRLAHVVRELPRRAHDLSRREVIESQRWRILEAVTEVTAKLGYAAATVADVIAVAGISRKTFYEQFQDKEDCFLTAYDVLSARLVRSLVSVGAELPSGPGRRQAQIEAFLAALQREPEIARVFMLDVLGAGRPAFEHRQRVNALFADAILGAAAPTPVLRSAIIGGLNNAVVDALLDGRGKRLRELAAPLAEFVELAISSRPRRGS